MPHLYTNKNYRCVFQSMLSRYQVTPNKKTHCGSNGLIVFRTNIYCNRLLQVQKWFIL